MIQQIQTGFPHRNWATVTVVVLAPLDMTEHLLELLKGEGFKKQLMMMKRGKYLKLSKRKQFRRQWRTIKIFREDNHKILY